ncbi:hypothetical protein [Streptomyces tsukubensis]|uniref:hypothetical protein n=1 Tax=Streptomyces tsukubensis TaxID=83656 RepID=UPI001E5BF4F0|nr:hypothetical protein [Streptomyces tsukubensis]
MGVRAWAPRQWLVAAGVAVLAAAVVGVPTGVVPSALYTRMTPVLWWNYPVWIVSSVLMGLLAATYTAGPGRARKGAGAPGASGADPARPGPRGARAIAAGVLSVLAVGCPVCNKLVVLALGMSGAMSYWAPAQPVLAIASVALLAHALAGRLRTADACPVPTGRAPVTDATDGTGSGGADTPGAAGTATTMSSH